MITLEIQEINKEIEKIENELLEISELKIELEKNLTIYKSKLEKLNK